MANGGHHLAFGVTRHSFSGQYGLGRSRQRVTAQQHRHRAGMTGFAEQFNIQVSLPCDRVHDAQRLVAILKHRALLDMDLDVSRDAARRISCGGNVSGVLAITRDGLGE